MRIVKNILKFFLGIIFTLFLGFLLVVPGLVEFTKYENLKPTVVEILQKRLVKESENQLNQVLENGKTICISSSQEVLKIPYGDDEIVIECKGIEKMKTEDLARSMSSKAFDSIYYKKYSCGFLNCLRELEGSEKFFVVVNEKGHNFFSQITIYILTTVIISGILLAYLIRDPLQIGKYFGIIFIFAGIPLFFTSFISNLLPVPLDVYQELKPLLNKVFQPINQNFTIVFILGITLSSIGHIGIYLRSRRK